MAKGNTYLIGLWAAIFICFCFITQAQEQSGLPTFRFEFIDLPGSEAGAHAQAIAQDSFGFMWFGKQQGLCRWDGYAFKEYLNDPSDTTSLANNYVEYIYVARDSTVWIGNYGGGLHRFDYATETFTRYAHDPDDFSSISDDLVFEILEDNEGYLWVATNNGVNRLDVSTGKFRRFNHDPNNANSLSYNSCGTICLDSEGTLWFGCGFVWEESKGGGLNRYRPETEDFVRYLHDPDDPASLISSKVHDIFEDSKGNFWIGTSGDGVHLMDRESGTFQRIENNVPDPLPYSAPFREIWDESHIRVFFEDNDNNIWIGAWGGGLKYYDPESGKFQVFYADEKNPAGLPENNSWNMMQTRDGTLWGLTAGPNAKVFKIKKSAVYDYQTFGRTQYYSISESRDKQLWIGTKASGLIKYDPVTKTQKIFDQSTFLPPVVIPEGKEISFLDLSDNFNPINCMDIVEDDEGWLYAIPHSLVQNQLTDGMVRMNPKTGETYIYNHSEGVGNSIGSMGVEDILIDNDNRVWVATSFGDLNLFNREDNTFTRYKYSNDNILGYGFRVVLEMANDGNIWVGASGIHSYEHTLFIKKFDPDAKAFLDFEIIAPFNDEQHNFEMLNAINEASNGSLWICMETAVKKINPGLYLNGMKPEDRSSSGNEILAEDAGAKMFSDFFFEDDNRIWILGNGLFSFELEPGNGKIVYSERAVINDFPYKGLLNTSDGLVYLMEPNGFVAIYPGQIREYLNTSLPETHITNFQILRSSSEPDAVKHLSYNALTVSDINLNYDQNAFSFNFAALHYNNPESNKHQFKLEGYDEDWRNAGLGREATYVKVPPGKYIFKVRGATNVSEWSPKRSVNVRIFPPWWATWWAYTIYSLCILGFLYFFYHTQLTKQLQKAETQRLKELDNVKTQLYTNITHEFRTPLTVILGMARQAVKEPAIYFDDGMKMIIRNGENLLSLVNQMLDLSKLESGKLKLNTEHGDIIAYLNYLIESFHSFAESKDIQIHFLSETESLSMDYDPEKFQQIIANLISNAVKFTPEGGHIYFSVSSEISKNEKDPAILVMKVRDTGVGIPENELPFIFDRFYQVDSSTKRSGEGTGIGLALTKELIKLMEGRIEVKSKVGQGTTFEVILPIYHEAKEKPATVIPEKINSENYQLQKDNSDKSVEKTLQNGKGGDTKKPLLLIAEDNTDVVQYLAFCLAEDYRLAVAKDGREGIDIALEITPDVIITDVMMPHVDGLELTTTLKNDERTSHIPIIMLTAKADVESKLEGLDKGVDAYLAKPFHKEELLIRVKKLLELRQALQNYYLSAFGLNGDVKPSPKAPVPLNSENEFVAKVKNVVEAHMDDFEFNMDKFCKEVGLGRSQLHRKLIALTGLSATKFIRYVRLNKARELLHDPDMTITAVAFDTGFNDPSYFGRVFKKEFGITPKEWQEKTKV